MAQRWMLAWLFWEFQGIRSSIAQGSGPPAPPPGSAHWTGQCIHLLRYTENPFYRAHRLLYDTLHTFKFYRMHKFLNWRNILSWIPFGSDLDPNRFCKCEWKRERLVHAHHFGKIKVQIEREREREREMCSFWISSFFKLRTRLRISKFRVYLCKRFWSTRCPWVTIIRYKRHLRRWRASESVLVFWRKNESVAIHRISGLLGLVSKLSDIACTCLAFDLAITARAGHFTDSVRGWKEKKSRLRRIISPCFQHVTVVSTTFLHAYIPFLLMLKTTF